MGAMKDTNSQVKMSGSIPPAVVLIPSLHPFTGLFAYAHASLTRTQIIVITRSSSRFSRSMGLKSPGPNDLIYEVTICVRSSGSSSS